MGRVGEVNNACILKLEVLSVLLPTVPNTKGENIVDLFFRSSLSLSLSEMDLC